MEWSERGFALFTLSNGRTFGIGDNSSGSLGVGHNSNILGRQEIEELKGQHLKEFTEGSGCVFARNSENEIFGWGSNRFGQLGTGKIGIEGRGGKWFKPKKLEFIYENTAHQIIQVSTGDLHNLALSINKTIIFGWGNIFYAQIKQKSNEIITQPEAINFQHILKDKESIDYIHCYANCSFAVTNTQRLFVWGEFYLEEDPLDNTCTIVQPPKVILNQFKVNQLIGADHFIYFISEQVLYRFNGKANQKIFDEKPVDKIQRADNDVIAIQASIKIYELFDICEDQNDFGKYVIQETSYSNLQNYFLIKHGKCARIESYARDEVKELHGYVAQGAKEVRIVGPNKPMAMVLETKIEPSKKEDYQVENIKNLLKNGKFIENFQIIETPYPNSFVAKKESTKKLFFIKRISRIKRDNHNWIKNINESLIFKNEYIAQIQDFWFEGTVDDSFCFTQIEFYSKNLKHLLEIKHDAFQRGKKENMSALELFVSYEMFRELTQCVAYLHDNSIIHGDLNTMNVIITPGQNKRFLKIVLVEMLKDTKDIFQAFKKSEMSEESGYGSQTGSDHRVFIAPECNTSGIISKKIDIYSLGQIGLELFEINWNDITNSFNEKDPYSYLGVPEKYNINNVEQSCSIIFSLMAQCICPDNYNLRPDCQEILTELSKFTFNRKLIVDDINYSEIRGHLKYFKSDQEQFFYNFLNKKLLQRIF